MPFWVINLSQFPSFNLGFSVVFWVGLIVFTSVIAVIKIIREININEDD